MIHYRDLKGRDLGVLNTPENRVAMKRALLWLGTQIYHGIGVTYLWPEDSKLYFGGPWLGAWDLVNHVYMPRGLKDPRTSWAEPVRWEPPMAKEAFKAFVKECVDLHPEARRLLAKYGRSS